MQHFAPSSDLPRGLDPTDMNNIYLQEVWYAAFRRSIANILSVGEGVPEMKPGHRMVKPVWVGRHVDRFDLGNLGPLVDSLGMGGVLPPEGCWKIKWGNLYTKEGQGWEPLQEELLTLRAVLAHVPWWIEATARWNVKRAKAEIGHEPANPPSQEVTMATLQRFMRQTRLFDIQQT